MLGGLSESTGSDWDERFEGLQASGLVERDGDVVRLGSGEVECVE